MEWTSSYQAPLPRSGERTGEELESCAAEFLNRRLLVHDAHAPPLADRPLAQSKAVEWTEHDLAAVVDGIPAGFGYAVVADIIGMDVDRHQIRGLAHLTTFPPLVGGQ